MKPTFFEDETNIIQYGELLRGMYEKESDPIKKSTLYFAMNVMGIKEYKAKTKAQDYVLANLDEKACRLEEANNEMERKISAMQKKIYALLILEIITVLNLILMKVML